MSAIRIIGFDPGLRRTGWGVIESEGTKVRHIANGIVKSDARLPLAERLLELKKGLIAVLEEHKPDEAAVEQTFVNKDPAGTLKLGQARAIALLAPAELGLPVAEYAPNAVKKAVVGAGHAEKDQVGHMIGVLMPGTKVANADAADALAIAICHAHQGGGADKIAEAIEKADAKAEEAASEVAGG